jgi:uncharacterized repeat protein (TIGR03803 family)
MRNRRSFCETLSPRARGNALAFDRRLVPERRLSMWFNSLRTSWKPVPSRGRREEPRPPRRGTRFALEQLETRLTLSLSTLASFNGTNGTGPTAALIMDSSGNLYGTANGGGASNDGTVFELAHGSGKITTLASFDGTDGADPYGALVMDKSGNLYGATFEGGASNDGPVFELPHGSSKITTLASFDGTDGANPHAALIMDSSGNLYGTTTEGGASDDGVLFELAHGSRTITALASFNGTDGEWPWGGLIMDGNGDLYGTAVMGGASGEGTVFELAKGSGKITALASFNGTDGANPYAGLIMDSSGNLYGTATGGGAASDGTVFELTGADVQTGQQTGANSAVDIHLSGDADRSPGIPAYRGQRDDVGVPTAKTQPAATWPRLCPAS